MFNLVRSHRQRYGLSVHDLAFLIKRSPPAVSQMEYGATLPSLEAALAFQVLFRQQARSLFPDLYEVVEDEVMRRAAHMLASLEGFEDRRSLAKRGFLEGLASPDNDQGV